MKNTAIIQAELELTKNNTVHTARSIDDIAARLDDAENRSGRNSLIFYGLPDTNPSESFAESEQMIIRHCRDHLGLYVNPKEIDRAHRLGRYTGRRCRPI